MRRRYPRDKLHSIVDGKLLFTTIEKVIFLLLDNEREKHGRICSVV